MIVGIIGTGTIGTILIESFIESEALEPEQLIIHNRTIQKARKLANKYRRIKVVNDNISLCKKADLIIVCTKPKDLHKTILEINPYLAENKCLVIVTSPASVIQLESIVDCSVARVIPSITNRAFSGVSLFTYGESCSEDWRQGLYWLFRHISKPFKITNAQTRIASDITSCGPAFMSFLTRMMIDDAVKIGNIDVELATRLTEEMIIGYADLLHKKHYTLESLQKKVMVPGGLTGEGIKVLEKKTSGVFVEVFEATRNKFKTDVVKIEEQIGVSFEDAALSD